MCYRLKNYIFFKFFFQFFFHGQRRALQLVTDNSTLSISHPASLRVVGSLGSFKILSIIQLTHFTHMFIFLLQYKYVFQRKKTFANKCEIARKFSHIFRKLFREILHFFAKINFANGSKSNGDFFRETAECNESEFSRKDSPPSLKTIKTRSALIKYSEHVHCKVLHLVV